MNDFSFGRKIKFDLSGNPIINANILPSTNITYDLGSSTQRWRDIYLSGNTIDLGGTLISKEVGGGIKIEDNSGNTLDGKFNNLDISNNIVASGNISASNLTTSGNITVGNNLIVNGTTTTVNSTTVTVVDPIITLGSDLSDNKDRGIEFRYNDGINNKRGFFGFDNSVGNLVFFKDATNTNEVFSGTQGTLEGSTFKSTVVSGTAPLTVTSSTLVTNLNADLLDGLNSTQFMRTDIDTSTTGKITSSSSITGTNIIASGNVGIGTINPQAALHVSGTGAMIIPAGTTEQIPLNPLLGMIRYNTTLNKLQYYNQAGWATLGGVSALGGNSTTDLNGYRIHIFTSSSSFTVYSGGNVETLVVAGGGGGGSGVAGGGGAGGLIYNSSFVVPNGSYSIVVGSGGTGGIDSSTYRGTNGENTSFLTLNAIGGGAGSSAQSGGPGFAALSGGSGGGGSYYSDSPGITAGAIGTVGQGTTGGNGNASYPSGAGGGGAGAGGASVTSNNGGNGGVGLQYSISGTAIFYAGGGGGGAGSGSVGSGGTGGGGAGGLTGNDAEDGSSNTGGGGGGGWNYAGGRGGNGGSGIVIIRYLL